MFRKLTIALAATVALGAAALAPTAASAGGGHGGHGYHGGYGHHGWGHGIGIGFYGPTYAAGGDCYYVRKVVHTPHGKRFHRVLVCD
jgi:hypothetical protein